MVAPKGVRHRSSGDAFAALVSALIFGLIYWAIVSGVTQTFDEKVIVSLRIPGHTEDARGNPWVEHLARDVTSFGATSPIMIMTIALSCYYVLVKQRVEGLQLLVTVATGIGCYTLLKYAVGRPRPELVSHLVYSTSSSFPSGHAMAATLFYLTLGSIELGKKGSGMSRFYGWSCVVLWIGAIGFSRVYLGVHWPTDVICGWAAGVAWFVMCRIILRNLACRTVAISGT